MQAESTNIRIYQWPFAVLGFSYIRIKICRFGLCWVEWKWRESNSRPRVAAVTVYIHSQLDILNSDLRANEIIRVELSIAFEGAQLAVRALYTS